MLDRCGNRMEKIGRPDASALLSKQVTGARYFFLNLAPNPKEPLALVMGGREQCNPDYVVMRRGFPFYVLEYVVSGHGSVRLDHRRHVLGPGMVFGEMAFLDGSARSGRAVAVNACLLYSLPREAFALWAQEHPHDAQVLLNNIAAQLSHRLRFTTAQLIAVNP